MVVVKIWKNSCVYLFSGLSAYFLKEHYTTDVLQELFGIFRPNSLYQLPVSSYFCMFSLMTQLSLSAVMDDVWTVFIFNKQLAFRTSDEPVHYLGCSRNVPEILSFLGFYNFLTLTARLFLYFVERHLLLIVQIIWSWPKFSYIRRLFYGKYDFDKGWL